MKNYRILIAFGFLSAMLFLFSKCVNDKKELIPISVQAETACYPDDVGKIFVEKCATAGCHNAKSKDAAAGLDMSTWDALFNGSRGGSAVIPYRADQSFLVNFINTYSDLGLSQQPTMPNNGTPLSHDEVQTVIKWINDGAPDCNGKRITDDHGQKKFYITNQACDLVSVWDADRKIIMRYINVGNDPVISEAPHKVLLSPDQKFWYVCFFAGNAKYFQKYRTSDDSFVGQADITIGSWNTFALTSDGKTAYIPDYSSGQGRVAIVDCETMTLKNVSFTNPFPSGCPNPHGSLMSPDGQYLYLTEQLSSNVYKIDITATPVPDAREQTIFQSNYSNYFNPHELAFSPVDKTIYFVTYEGTINSGGVLVYKFSNDFAKHDSIIKEINVGGDPVEMSFSTTKPYLFVSCMNGNAVSIINYQDLTLVKTIDTPGLFDHPHGIGVDDAHGVCYVVNRNATAPHHVSVCAGANGYLLEIDLNTLEVIPGFKAELSVDPYSIAIEK